MIVSLPCEFKCSSASSESRWVSKFKTMDVDSVFVTGANRGIGLELVRQLVHLPKPPRMVFATYRNRNTVQALKNIRDTSKKTEVVLIKMDVTKTDEVEAARKIVEDMVAEKGLTLLVNNAGALDYQGFQEITEENLLFHFTANTIGPIKVLKEMLPLLQRAATARGSKKGVSRAAVLNISSTGGSNEKLDGTQPPEWLNGFGYRISKAALNMAMRLVAVQMRSQDVLVVQMCPGWVKTDMGTDRGHLEVTDSVASILDTLSRLDESHHGAFIDHKGDIIPF